MRARAAHGHGWWPFIRHYLEMLAAMFVGMAVLAASSGRSLDDTAREMVSRGEQLDPRPDRVARFEQSFRLLVDALAERGYLTTELAAKAVTS